MYIDKFTYLIIRIDNIEDSHKAQKILYQYNIDWKLDTIEDSRHIYNDMNCYYTCNLVKKEINYSNYSNIEISKSYRLSNKKIYKMTNPIDISHIKQILEYGDIIPSYRPKKIERII